MGEQVDLLAVLRPRPEANRAGGGLKVAQFGLSAVRLPAVEGFEEKRAVALGVNDVPKTNDGRLSPSFRVVPGEQSTASIPRLTALVCRDGSF
jgi:hypothetical protein